MMIIAVLGLHQHGCKHVRRCVLQIADSASLQGLDTKCRCLCLSLLAVPPSGCGAEVEDLGRPPILEQGGCCRNSRVHCNRVTQDAVEEEGSGGHGQLQRDGGNFDVRHGFASICLHVQLQGQREVGHAQVGVAAMGT